MMNKKLIVGLKIRTSNEDGRVMREVPPLWMRFFQEELMKQIPHRLSDDLFVVYSNYEKDYTKPYDYLLGCEVSKVDALPKDMTSIEIPVGKYERFETVGEYPASLGRAWQTIWQSDLERAYLVDFEYYPAGCLTEAEPKVGIYIGV